MAQIRWIAEHLEEVLGAGLLALMAGLAFANVLTRYLFHLSLAYTEELEVNSLVWLTLVGASSAFRKRRHLRMVFFRERLPLPLKNLLDLIMAGLGMALFSLLGYLGYQQLLDERLLEITSEALGLPQWLYTVAIPVGCALVVLRILLTVVTDIRDRGR